MSNLDILKQMVDWTSPDLETNTTLPKIPLAYDYMRPNEADIWTDRIKIIHSYLTNQLKEELFPLWKKKCIEYFNNNPHIDPFVKEQWDLYWSGVRDQRIHDLMCNFVGEHGLKSF